MAESDLKRICQSIPVTDAGDISTQAHNILYGISGDDVEFDIQTGSSPTLFPAPLTSALNKIKVGSTETADLNGGFAQLVSIKATIDDVEVQLLNNEYAITPSDDGKTLTITLSAVDFLDGVSNITLTYIDPSTLNTIIINTGSISGLGFGFGIAVDVSSFDYQYMKYVFGNYVFDSQSSGLKIYILGYCYSGSFTVRTTLPALGIKVLRDFTIRNDDANFNPTAVLYPIGKFWLKAGSTVWYAEHINDDVFWTTSDLPTATSTAYNVPLVINWTITNTRTSSQYTVNYTGSITRNQYYNSVDFNQTTYGAVELSCLTQDSLSYQITVTIGTV